MQILILYFICISVSQYPIDNTIITFFYTAFQIQLDPIQFHNYSIHPLNILFQLLILRMIASSIQLTAKKSHYGVDGTGRDSYINFDNGGNYRGYTVQGKGKFEIGTFRDKSINKRRSYTGVEGKPLHYIGDGTGRDFYVISNEGGIADRGVHKKFNFLESLRTPIPRKQVKDNDVFMKTNDTWKSRHSKDTKAFSSYQKHLMQRLCEPKITEDPYSNIRQSFRSSVGFKSRRK